MAYVFVDHALVLNVAMRANVVEQRVEEWRLELPAVSQRKSLLWALEVLFQSQQDVVSWSFHARSGLASGTGSPG